MQPENQAELGPQTEEHQRLALMIEKSVETAERMIQRLRQLQEKYPSDDVAAALRTMERWRDRLQTGER